MRSKASRSSGSAEATPCARSSPGTGLPRGVADEPLLVHLAVEMDGEARDAQQRPPEVDERAARPAVRAQRDRAREREVAIEPGVEQHAPVGLDGVALVARARRVG